MDEEEVHEEVAEDEWEEASQPTASLPPVTVPFLSSESERTPDHEEQLQEETRDREDFSSNEHQEPLYKSLSNRAHIFFYAWYGNVELLLYFT